MKRVIEFYRIRESDDAHAITDADGAELHSGRLGDGAG